MNLRALLFCASVVTHAGCYDRQVVGVDADADVDVDSDGDTDVDGDADGDGDADPPSWTREVVDIAADDGEQVAITADSRGVPHIIYNWSDNTGDELHHERRYATLVDGRWAIETIEDIVGSHMPSVVVIDPEGTVQAATLHMESNRSDSLTVRRLVRTSDGWVTEVVGGPSRMSDLAMAMDASGAMHVAYTVGEDAGAAIYERLRYATNASGAWAIEEVAPAEVAGSLGIALDSTGSPRIAYLAGTDAAQARLARLQGGVWLTEAAAAVVPDPLATYDRVIAWDGPMGLVIDDADVDHLFVPGGAMVYADDAAGAWSSESIASVGEGGSYAIAALQDRSGRFHAARVEFGPIVQDRFFGFGISYASGGPGAWVTESVESCDRIDTDVGLAIDSGGALHLAYVDGDDEVVYARLSPN